MYYHTFSYHMLVFVHLEQDVIRDAPKNLNELLEVLLPRLQPRPEVRGVSMEDQQSLVKDRYL